jgi:hypothetical protein
VRRIIRIRVGCIYLLGNSASTEYSPTQGNKSSRKEKPAESGLTIYVPCINENIREIGESDMRLLGAYKSEACAFRKLLRSCFEDDILNYAALWAKAHNRKLSHYNLSKDENATALQYAEKKLMKYYMENRQKFECNAIMENIFENYGNDDFEEFNILPLTQRPTDLNLRVNCENI